VKEGGEGDPEPGSGGTTSRKLAFLEATARERPEYAEVLSLFREIYAYIRGKERETGISFESPRRNASDRVGGGLPLLSPDAMRVDREAAARFLSGLLAVVKKAGRKGGEEISGIERAVTDGAADLATLYTACLARDRTTLEEAAGRTGVPSSLLAFVLEIPLKTALERAAEGIDPAAFEGWKESYCPVCGSPPGMDEIVGEEGKRFLCCSGCFFKWPFRRVKCPYCGNEDPDSLSYFLAEEEPTRVTVCRKCSRYIKTRDSRRGHADVPLEALDLSTLHLDLLAGREGFERGR
jgi:FdhE protein